MNGRRDRTVVGSCAVLTSVGEAEVGNLAKLDGLAGRTFAQFRGELPYVQVDLAPHLAALVGIVALVFLGGGLVARNRLSDPTASPHEDVPRTRSEGEFMTDRERIHHLITDNGGRMKQSEIVDAVDWSKAKVSRLLADLEEDGEITKLRLGRENLICLRGQEPPASRSSEGSSSE